MRQAAYWSVLDDRLVDWVERSVKRKTKTEARVVGCLRAAADESKSFRKRARPALARLVEREAFDRPLFAALVRAAVADRDEDVVAILGDVLRSTEGGGLHALAATSECDDDGLFEPLSRLAAHPKPLVAFAASFLLRRRGKGRAGLLLRSVARIKESARIEICEELLAPCFLRAELPPLPESVAAPMKVLRDAERHLGRWLVFARAGRAGGDDSALQEAEGRREEGSSSSRTAWALLAWDLGTVAGKSPSPPEVRPSAEIVARLSDRPTSEKDMSFLFRLADVRAEGARGMLASLCKGTLSDPVAVRAASTLARVYDDDRGLDGLRSLAEKGRPRELTGLAVAGLFDAGQVKEARQHAEDLLESRHHASAVWGGLVMKGAKVEGPLLGETRYRRLCHGWVQ